MVATELSKSSVKLAQLNLEANGVENAVVARLSAEEFVQAYEGGKSFKRLADAGIELRGEGGGLRA